MSTRSLIELDHDKCASIEKSPQEFATLLLEYMRNPDSKGQRAQDLADSLRWNFGVILLGARHHSDPYHVSWGYNKTYTGFPGG